MLAQSRSRNTEQVSQGSTELNYTGPYFTGWLDNDLKSSNNFLDDDDDVDDLGKTYSLRIPKLKCT